MFVYFIDLYLVNQSIHLVWPKKDCQYTYY